MTRAIAAPLVLIFACLALLVATGRGDGGPTLIRVTGVVTLEG